MPAVNPRITFTLKPEEYAVIKRLAELQQSPVSRIVSDLVAEVVPTLSRLCNTMEVAVRAQEDAKANLRIAVDRAEADLAPLADAVKSQFDMLTDEVLKAVEGGKNAGSQRRSDDAFDPRPVITGVRNSCPTTNNEKNQSLSKNRGTGVSTAKKRVKNRLGKDTKSAAISKKRRGK